MINKKLLAKSMLVWLGVLPLAIINGALRDYALTPLIGHNIAMPISGILLSVMIFFLAFIFLPLLGNGSIKTYILMGLIWMASTVILEFIIGFITQVPMAEMLAAYNFLTGNLWSVVLVFIVFIPWTAAKARKLTSTNDKRKKSQEEVNNMSENCEGFSSIEQYIEFWQSCQVADLKKIATEYGVEFSETDTKELLVKKLTDGMNAYCEENK